MLEVIKKIIENVLTSLYQPFGFSVIMAVLVMFLYLFMKEHGWKVVVQRWLKEFKTNHTFRRMFFLIFYTAMILFKTLLNRDMWKNPVSNVMGVWGIYNQNGDLTTEAIENFALFVPFIVLLLWCFHEKILGESAKLLTTLWKSVAVVFLFSLTIEFSQLLFRLGTFQLSDLFYNTLGGLIGGLVYWFGHKISKKK